ncbi:MAG: ferritin-like domain-containing protein [Candidatus Saccharibacteria bacterium]|nr:ferritin-like domain-containing protein [Pseudorhodobacter sp.]
MAAKTLEDLFLDTLKDVYYAERKILKTLPKMERAATAPELKQAFNMHRQETEGQVARLEQVFEILGKRAQGKTCAAIDGITDEGAELIEEYGKSPAMDAALTAVAQAVEHYEIARYGALRTWAETLGYSDAVSLLEETLDEEKAADEKLTEIAQTVNSTAMAAE